MRTRLPLQSLATALRHLMSREVCLSPAIRRLPLAGIQLPLQLVLAVSHPRPARPALDLAVVQLLPQVVAPNPAL